LKKTGPAKKISGRRRIIVDSFSRRENHLAKLSGNFETVV